MVNGGSFGVGDGNVLEVGGGVDAQQRACVLPLHTWKHKNSKVRVFKIKN